MHCLWVRHSQVVLCGVAFLTHQPILQNCVVLRLLCGLWMPVHQLYQSILCCHVAYELTLNVLIHFADWAGCTFSSPWRQPTDPIQTNKQCTAVPCNRCTYCEPPSSSLGLHRSGRLKKRKKDSLEQRTATIQMTLKWKQKPMRQTSSVVDRNEDISIKQFKRKGWPSTAKIKLIKQAHNFVCVCGVSVCGVCVYLCVCKTCMSRVCDDKSIPHYKRDCNMVACSNYLILRLLMPEPEEAMWMGSCRSVHFAKLLLPMPLCVWIFVRACVAWDAQKMHREKLLDRHCIFAFAQV